MKIVTFTDDARSRFGVLTDDGIHDATDVLGQKYSDVRAVLAAGALDELRNLEDAPVSFAADGVTFLPPVRPAESILVVGRNYGEAMTDMGTDFVGYPSIFMRRTSAQVGHNQPIVRPAASPQYDCEAELAIIIGKAGRHISEEKALDHIAGYSIFNEASVVDWMDHTSRNVTPGKNFEACGAFGPSMVTADEIPDPGNLRIIQRINGEVIQDGNTADMIYSLPRIINYLSTFTTLQPGDVIATGSPGGVRPRRNAGVFLKPGDVVEMEIPGVGLLRNPVIDEAA